MRSITMNVSSLWKSIVLNKHRYFFRVGDPSISLKDIVDYPDDQVFNLYVSDLEEVKIKDSIGRTTYLADGVSAKVINLSSKIFVETTKGVLILSAGESITVTKEDS